MKNENEIDYGARFIEMLEAMDQELAKTLTDEQRELKEKIQKLMGDNNDEK